MREGEGDGRPESVGPARAPAGRLRRASRSPGEARIRVTRPSYRGAGSNLSNPASVRPVALGAPNGRAARRFGRSSSGARPL